MHIYACAHRCAQNLLSILIWVTCYRWKIEKVKKISEWQVGKGKRRKGMKQNEAENLRERVKNR